MDLKFSGASPGHQPVPGACSPAASESPKASPRSEDMLFLTPHGTRVLEDFRLLRGKSLPVVSSVSPGFGPSEICSVYLPASFPWLLGGSPGMAPCLTCVCFTISALAIVLHNMSSQAWAAWPSGILRSNVKHVASAQHSLLKCFRIRQTISKP